MFRSLGDNSYSALKPSHPMAFNEKSQRLFIGSRDPPVLVAFDTNSDQMVTKVPSVRGGSTSFLVPEFNRLYIPAMPYAGQPAQVLVYEAQP